jgi:hypothetical protein
LSAYLKARQYKFFRVRKEKFLVPPFRACLRGGLSPVWVSSLVPEFDNFSFVQSLLNWLGVRPNLLYNWLRGQSAKVIGGNRAYGSALATVLLAPVLGALSLPVTLLLAVPGRGATLTITAVKKSPPPELP